MTGFKGQTNYSHSTCKKNDVKQTSREAFRKKISDPSYQTDTMKVYVSLKRLKRATRLMLNEVTDVKDTSMTQFVKALLQKGLIKEEVVPRECKASGNKALYLYID